MLSKLNIFDIIISQLQGYEKGNIKVIDYGVYALSEEEQANPNKIQLKTEYVVDKKDGFYIELYIEDGVLKHRYIEIPKTSEQKEIERLSSDLLSVKKATAEIFELMSNGGNV